MHFFAEVKRSMSLLHAAVEVNGQGLLHVERQDGMRALGCSETAHVVPSLQKVNTRLPKISDPNHNAGIEVLMCSKNVTVGKLPGNIHTHLEL